MKNTLEAIKNDLDRLSTWIHGDYYYKEVSIEEDEYPVDLGNFGEQTLAVSLSTREEIEPADVIEEGGLPLHRLDEIISELEGLMDEAEELLNQAREQPKSLHEILTQMTESEDEDAKALAGALLVLANLTAKEAGSIIHASSASTGPLPWPGSNREDIDYTADDFPMRYEPPPGWMWNKTGRAESENVEDPAEAVALPVADVQARNTMILDKHGCISWPTSHRGDDDMATGSRWLVWCGERNGVPKANLSGMGSSVPRSFPADESSSSAAPSSEFAPPATVSV